MVITKNVIIIGDQRILGELSLDRVNSKALILEVYYGGKEDQENLKF